MTTTNSLFLFDNQADNATITASSEAGATMAAENVQVEQRSIFWRSGAGTSSHLQAVLATTYGVNYAALIDVNLSTVARIRLQSWADSVGGAVPGVDITVPASLVLDDERTAVPYGYGAYGVGVYGTAALTQANIRNITLIPLGALYADAYWKVTFTDIVGDYQQVGRFFLGRAFEFEKNLSWGWSAERVDLTVRRESIGGQAYRQERDTRLKINGSFEHLNDTERTRLLTRLQSFGNSKPFIYTVFPEGTNRGLSTTLYGRFDAANIGNPNYGSSRMGFTVIEEL